MKLHKPLLSLGVAALTVGVAVSGCGTATTTNKASGGGQGSANSSTTNTPVSNPNQSVTLNFMNVGATPQVMTYFNQTVIPDFEKKYPNIHVTMENVDWGNSFNKITTGVASHNAPDVFMMGGIWTAPLASKNALLNIDKYVNQWSEKSDFFPAAWSDGTYKGSQYAVPVNLDIRGLYYRTDLLKAKGLSVPATWQQYYNDAKKLTVKSGNTIKVEGADFRLDNSVGLYQAFAQLFLQAGGSYFNAAGTKAEFNTQAGKDALKYLLSFYQNGISSRNDVIKGSAPEPLALGRAAMAFTNSAAIQNAKQYDPSIAAKLELATTPLSQVAGKAPKTLEFVNKLGIYSGTKYPDQSWKFVQYLCQPSVLSKWDTMLGEIPPLQSLANQAPWNTGSSVAEMKVAKYAVPQPGSPAMFQVIHTINDTLEQALIGQLTVDQCLQQIDSKVDVELAPQK